MKKKVVQSLYSGLGGHANVVFSLLDSDFLSRYINVLVFFGIEKTLPSYLKRANSLGVKNYSILKKPKHYRKSIRDFYNILKNEKPEIVIIHNSELIYSAVKYKKKAITTKIFFVEHEPNHSKTLFENLISKYAAKKADTVICLNENYMLELSKKYKGNFVVVPNGLNTNLYKRRAKLNSVKVIGMAARLVDTKDHNNLLVAFSKLLDSFPYLILKIAGTGDQYEQLLTITKKLKIQSNVKFVGLLNESEMIDFYNSIDLYVHATLSETLSTSILQAMSCEHIVITSNIQNNRELIEDGISGILYENLNPLDLYEKMAAVINNVNEYRVIGAEARKRIVEKYSNVLMSDNYQKVIEK